MSDRRDALRALAGDVATREDVQDAWLAKHCTDRLFVVEVGPNASLPEVVTERLQAAGLRGANEVYDLDDGDAAYAGQLADGRRYRFVDCESRGELQSYVLE